MAALLEAIEATEKHLRGLGFDLARLSGREGIRPHRGAARRGRSRLHVRRIQATFRDPGPAGVRPIQGSDHGARRVPYAERHDNIEAIYKKLEERRDTADVTDVLKELHRIVNEAIRAAEPGDDQAEGLTCTI